MIGLVVRNYEKWKIFMAFRYIAICRMIIDIELFICSYLLITSFPWSMCIWHLVKWINLNFMLNCFYAIFIQIEDLCRYIRNGMHTMLFWLCQMLLSFICFLIFGRGISNLVINLPCSCKVHRFLMLRVVPQKKRTRIKFHEKFTKLKGMKHSCLNLIIYVLICNFSYWILSVLVFLQLTALYKWNLPLSYGKMRDSWFLILWIHKLQLRRMNS